MNTTVISLLSGLDANALATGVLRWLGLSLMYGTVLAAVTWIVLKTAFRKSGLMFAGAIWTVVLLKFVIPTGPGIPYSMATLADSIRGSVRPADKSPSPAASPANSADDVQFITIFESGFHPTDVIPPAHSRSPWSIPVIIAAVYMALLFAISFWRGNRYMAFIRRCRALPKAEREIGELVERTCQRHGIHRTIDVRVSDDAAAPFVVGLFRPMLVLSTRHLADSVEAEAVILHEIGHVRPFDVLLRVLQCLVGTLLFFWPVVAWVNRRIDLAREHACDDWALSHGKLTAAEYARCLLRALQPVRSSWSIYRPAAMAANRRHVERRIEMILQHPDRSRHARSLGVGALLIVGAWAVFTLSGSKPADAAIATADVAAVQSDIGTKKIIVTRVNQSGDGQMNVKVVRINDGELNVKVEGAGEPIDVVVPTGEVKARAMAFVAADGAQPCVTGASFARVDEAELSEFANQHPAADLDADGKVSPKERDAYLTAVASLAPAAVLQKYPNSDKNADGTLDINEAARLVMGDFFDIALPGSGEPHVMAFAGTGTGVWQAAEGDCLKVVEGHPIQVQVVGVDANASNKEAEAIVIGGDANEPQTIELEVDCDVDVKGDANDDANVKTKTIVVRPAGATGEWKQAEGELPTKIQMKLDAVEVQGFPLTPADKVSSWLQANVLVVPTIAQLRAATTAVELAPLAQFKDMHPEADVDKNGELTAEEREAFLAEEMKNVRVKVLEQFPDADANKDGELTETEMHEFFKARAGAGGFSAVRIGQPVELNENVIFVGEAKPATVQVEGQPVKCKVIVRTSPGESAEADATTERP